MPRYLPPREIGQWAGTEDRFNGLWRTFNVDLDRHERSIGLSRRLISVADTTTATTLDRVDAFVQSDADCTDRYWALTASGGLFRTSGGTPNGTWASDSLVNTPTSLSDMAIFENDSTGDTGRQQLFVTTTTDVASLNDTGDRAWNNSWWVTTKGQTALISSVPHPIAYFPFQKMMIFGDGYRVHTFSRTSITASEAVTASRLVFPADLQIEHIFITSTRAWFLCANTKGGYGKVIEWDGFSQSPNAIHDVYSEVPIAGVNFYDQPLVLNNKGLFLEFNGQGFTPMVRGGRKIAFPMNEEEGNSMSGTGSTRLMRPKGMVVDNDLIYLNSGGTLNQSFRQGSGIWCLNPFTGRLYTKYSTGQWGSLDWGQIRGPNSSVGAMYSVSPGGTTRSLLIGGKAIVTSGGTKSYIWTLEPTTTLTANKGYFETQFIPAEEVKDFWDTLWIRFRRFLTDSNRIIVKARGTQSMMNRFRQPSTYNATWTSASTFTVQLSASDDALVVGDEVEVTSGDNAGSLAHITVISGAHAAVQTITIDETLNAVVTVSEVRFDRWKKLGTISSTSVYEHSLNIGINSSYIQFKVEMRGPALEMEINDMIVNSKPQVYSQK